MNASVIERRPRGRPSRHGKPYADTRELLVRRGVELLTERGMAATALEDVLKTANVPKGSFYHYFSSKDTFVLAALDAYADYFLRKLDRHLNDEAVAPLARLQAFVDDACEGVERHAFQRGCMVGNLGQEVAILDESLRSKLEQIFSQWEGRVASCLALAQTKGELRPGVDCAALANAFWIGWEGAILRARLARSTLPMRTFFGLFMAAVR